MPEIPIDENYHLGLPKNYIGISGKASNIDPVAKSQAPKLLP